MAIASPPAWSALGYSVGVHLSALLATILYANALGQNLGWMAGLAVMPAALVANALPISVNGWGVREGAMVAAFVMLGLDGDAAFVVSIMIGLSATVLALPGGLAWLMLPSRDHGVVS